MRAHNWMYGIPVDANFTWDYEGNDSASAITINSGAGGTTTLTGLNLRQVGTTRPLIDCSVDRDIVLENCRLDWTYRAIWMTGGGKLTLRNCHSIARNPGVLNAYSHWFANGFSGLDVQGNTLRGGGGFYASSNDQTGGFVIERNDFIDLMSLRSNGTGLPGTAGYILNEGVDVGWLNHAIQLNNTTAANGSVRWNRFRNTPGVSRIDDIINLSSSGGAAGQPLVVADNYFDGVQPVEFELYYNGGCAVLLEGSGAKGQYVDILRNSAVRVMNIAYQINSSFTGHHINLQDNWAALSGIYNGKSYFLMGNQPYYGAGSGTYQTWVNNSGYVSPGKGGYISVANLANTGNAYTAGSNLGTATQAVEDARLAVWQAARIVAGVAAPGSSIPVW